MSSMVSTNLTAEGSHDDIEFMLSFLLKNKTKLDKSKLEHLCSCELSFRISDSAVILFSPFSKDLDGNKVLRQRALLVDSELWLSNDIETSFVARLSAMFPKLIWKIYFDDAEWSAACTVFEMGFATHENSFRDDAYLKFSIVNPDDEFSDLGFVNEEIDHDAIKNAFDEMHESNIGAQKDALDVLDYLRLKLNFLMTKENKIPAESSAQILAALLEYPKLLTPENSFIFDVTENLTKNIKIFSGN
jgi:hypothetical protein